MITLHGFTCINFSTQAHSGALYIVIPTKNSCKPDCICPIILIADQDCLNFQVCSCIMDTLFNNSLSLCAVTPTHFQLCISNVTNGMNNTNVHLYTRTYSNCAQPYRKYIKAFKIFIGDVMIVIIIFNYIIIINNIYCMYQHKNKIIVTIIVILITVTMCRYG